MNPGNPSMSSMSNPQPSAPLAPVAAPAIAIVPPDTSEPPNEAAPLVTLSPPNPPNPTPTWVEPASPCEFKELPPLSVCRPPQSRQHPKANTSANDPGREVMSGLPE